MTTREEIIQALGQLDPATFEDVISTAYRTRYDSIEAAGQTSPDPREGPETFGRWLAQRHMSSDAAIDRVVYLPAGAPKEEIRLLEVNRLLNAPDDDAIEPLDFTPELADLPFKVLAADVTTDQWEQIKRDGGVTLPAGWKLEGHRIFSRG